MNSVKLGVLASGGGTNLQAIIDACEHGILKGKASVAVVIANKPDAYALERARTHGIAAVFIDRKCFGDPAAFNQAVIEEMKKHEVELVCLAGYLLKLEPNLIAAFKHRIINIHPALLPKFGGKGMYGHHVHEAVLNAGEKESGPSVHWVDEEYDHGAVILQCSVTVQPGDTPETLAQRVLEVEHKIFPEAILKIINEMQS